METKEKNAINQLILFFLAILFCCAALGKGEHTQSKHEITITPQSQQIAGIKTQALQLQKLPTIITAPGEVVPNSNQISVITTRINAQVVKRLAYIGQHVNKGQPLVKLSSVAMANAQGNFIANMQEWHRVKNLSKGIVPARRVDKAKIAYEQSYGRLISYGMTPKQVKKLIKSTSTHRATGNFTLLSPRNGIITKGNIVEGEIVSPGRKLFTLMNESSLWIDAKLAPSVASHIKLGAPATIVVGTKRLSGKVIQIFHQLDTATRTRTVRIELQDPNDLLHPGEFVETQIAVGAKRPALVVPITAVMRTQEGGWAIFIEKKPNVFTERKIKVGQTLGNKMEIFGVQPGTKVVTDGAFFVRSELNKSGFAVHNHS